MVVPNGLGFVETTGMLLQNTFHTYQWYAKNMALDAIFFYIIFHFMSPCTPPVLLASDPGREPTPVIPITPVSALDKLAKFHAEFLADQDLLGEMWD